MRPFLATALLCAVPLPAVANFHLYRRPAQVQAYYYPAPFVYPSVVPSLPLPASVVVQPIAPARVPISAPAPAPLVLPPAALPPCAPLAIPAPAPASSLPVPEPAAPPVSPPAAPPVPAPAPPPAAEPPPRSRDTPIRRYYAPSGAEQTSLLYEVYPSAGIGSARPGNTVTLSFWNQSTDSLVLEVDGQAYLLVAGKNLNVTARRQFAWQVGGRATERGEVPPGEKGLTIVIRR